MRDTRIITLYNNKGNRNDCNNHRGIFPLSQGDAGLPPETGWAYLSWVAMWIPCSQVHGRHDFLRPSIAGEMLWTAEALLHCLLELTKAYDLVSREGLFEILPTSLPTWDQPSRTTCLWPYSNTDVLGRLQRCLLALPHASGRTLSSLRWQRWQCRKLTFAIHSCTAVKLGSPTPSIKGNSTPSTCPAFGESFTWQDRVPSTEVLSRAGLPSMYTILRQRCLGYVRHMEGSRIPKNMLYS